MYQIRTEGMTCGGCAGAVTRAVKALDASATVSVDLETQRITVDSTKAREEVARVINEIGFPILESSAD